MGALKRKDENLLLQVDNIRNALFPSGVIQERSENILAYYYEGESNFIDEIYNNTEPFSFDLKVVELRDL